MVDPRLKRGFFQRRVSPHLLIKLTIFKSLFQSTNEIRGKVPPEHKEKYIHTHAVIVHSVSSPKPNRETRITFSLPATFTFKQFSLNLHTSSTFIYNPQTFPEIRFPK